MRFRRNDFDINDFDVVRVSDVAGGLIIKGQVEVLGVDQRGELIVHALQECPPIPGGTRQISDFIQHPLGDLGSRQGIGLQPVA